MSDYDYMKKERIRTSIAMISNVAECVHKTCVDRVPERYVKRDYIIDKLYDPKKSVRLP